MKRISYGSATGNLIIPLWLWIEYALELTPAIPHILNVSLSKKQLSKILRAATLGKLRPIDSH